MEEVTQKPKMRRHRFQKVQERVQNLQTELQLHAKTNNASELQLTFLEELVLQGELTLLESFQVLYRKIYPLVQTTPQLLHHLPKIVQLLATELQFEHDAEVQRERMTPVLKLLTALARELKKEFYPHFANVLPHIIAIIDTKDPELSTQVFKTLTMLFNYLRIQLLRDMDAVHKCYFPLLGHSKPFVREFAAQTLSVLLRRMDNTKDLQKYLTTYLRAVARGSAAENQFLQDGSAKLLLALVKNVNHGFHSRMQDIYVALLASFRPKDGVLEQERTVMCDILMQTNDLILRHTDATHADELLQCFLRLMPKVLVKHESTERDFTYLAQLLRMMEALLKFRSGKLLPNATQAKQLREFVASLIYDNKKPSSLMLKASNDALRQAILRVADLVWRLFCDPEDDADVIETQLKTVFGLVKEEELEAFWRQELVAYVDTMLTSVYVTPAFVKRFVMAPAMQLAAYCLRKREVAMFSTVICDVGTYIGQHSDVMEQISNVVVHHDQRFLLFEEKLDKLLLKNAKELMETSLKEPTDAHLAHSFKILKAMAWIYMAPDQLIAFVQPQLKHIEALADQNAAACSAIRAELWRLLQIATHQSSKSAKKSKKNVLMAAIEGRSASYATLSAFVEFLQMQTSTKLAEFLPQEALDAAVEALEANLRSRSHPLRLMTLEILARFERLAFILDDKDAAFEGPCDLLDLSLALERHVANVSVETEREMVRLLTRIKILSRSPQTPVVYKRLACQHLFGLYHVKFATLWPHVAECMSTIVKTEFQILWPTVSSELQAAVVRQEDASADSTEKTESNDAIAQEFASICRLERGEIDPNRVTDAVTHHSLLWKGMAQCIEQIETKTKFIVPLFLWFLQQQYAQIYKDELSTDQLEEIDQLLHKVQWSMSPSTANLTTKVVRNKFLDFLKFFAKFQNMKGAFANPLLHAFFFDLLMKSDEIVSKLALQCIFCFGRKQLAAYKESLTRIADSSSFREELTNFNVRQDSGVVLKEHRTVVLPVLMRLLYSKCVSKKGRNAGDTVAARRTAILAYLAGLEPSELMWFVELVVRAFPLTTSLANKMADDGIQLIALETVQHSRMLGFLNLLEDLMAQLGIKLVAFVPTIADLLCSILAFNETKEENQAKAMKDAEEEEEQDEKYALSMRKHTRMLTLRRLAELIDKFDAHVALKPWVQWALTTSNEAIEHLPKTVVGADKASALLDLLVFIANAPHVRSALSQRHIVAVISCLSSGLSSESTTRGIQPDILNAVLQFMDLLLDGDEQSGSQSLIPHVPLVLKQFVARFEAKAARYAEERYAGSSKKELLFLCRLSTHVATSESSKASAHDLFQLLLPFLQRNHHSSATDMTNILGVLANLVPLLSGPEKHVLALSKLLAPGPNCLNDRHCRQQLVHVFTALSQHDTLKEEPSFVKMTTLLQDLNAFDAKKIEEIDFERRMDALNSIHQSQFQGFMDEAHVLSPLMSQLLAAMHDTEYSIRSAALRSLMTFVDVVSVEYPVQVQALEALVMPCVRFSLKSPVEDTRRGFVMLLGHLADQSSIHSLEWTHGRDLHLLRNKEDVEVDFFYNLTHIQAHRKRRALQRLRSFLLSSAADQLSSATVNHILLPLLLHFVFETQSKSQESIREEAAMCIGAAASRLGFSQYFALLRKLLKSIDGHEASEATIIQSICHVIDQYHFEAINCATTWQPKNAPKDENSKAQANMETQVLPMLKKYLFKGVTDKGKAKLQQKKANVGFDDSIVSQKQVTVRVPLALAIVKVLRRLKASSFYREFPKLLISFVKLLRSREEDVRVSARTTLVKITVELGPEYLLPIVQELKATLNEGYMVYVLSYTLHAVLTQVSSMVAPRRPPSLLETQAPQDPETYASPLDACIPSIMAIVVQDLFRSSIENQDGTEYKSKMKEAKASQSLESLELLARSITFLPNPSIHSIVEALVTKFQENENAKAIQTLQNAFKRIALGLSKNAGIDASYMFLYAYNLLQTCLERVRPLSEEEKHKYALAKDSIVRGGWVSSWLVNEKSQAAKLALAKRVQSIDTAKVTLQSRMTGYDRHQVADQAQSMTHVEELLQYAVSLVHSFLKIKEKDTTSPSLVDPLVPHLMRCAAEVKNNRVVIQSLKCLSLLLNNHALPSMDVALPQLIDRLFKILQKAGASTRNEMVQTCYRALTVLLRQRSELKLSESQLRVLLSFVRVDLEEMDHQNATYSLLKSIIASRLVISEVYDVMVRIGELLVQSDAQSARSNCSSIYITFLLEYPLGPKRLAQHFKFLVQNLAYTYESGRKAVLECLGALVKKLPINLLNERAQFFLLPLILRLANDESSVCRSLASDVIKNLCKRMGNHQLNESVLLISKWWTSDDAKLVCTAAQATGLVLASRPEFLEKTAFQVLKLAQKHVEKRLELIQDVADDTTAEATEWQVVYHTLVCLHKFSVCLPHQLEGYLVATSSQLMDTVVVPALEYPHAWIRLATLQLLNSYLERRDAESLALTCKLKKTAKDVETKATSYLKTDGKLFALASGICKLIEKPQFSNEVADHVLKTLPFLCSALRSQRSGQLIEHEDHEEDQEDQSEPEDEEAEEDQEDQEDEKDHKTTRSNKSPVGWILTRLSFVARSATPAVQMMIFKLFAALIHANDASFLKESVVQLINPLYRAATVQQPEDQAQKDQLVEEASLLAQEVLQMLEKEIGATAFVDAYTFVQKKLMRFRAQRKEKRKRELVNDPAMAAKRKMQKNEQKRKTKQLKKRKFAVMKGTASAAAKPRKAMRPGMD